MNKKVVAHTESRILLTHGKEWNLTIWTAWVDLEGISTKWSQKKAYSMQFHLYKESKGQNKWTKQNRLMDTENRLMVVRGEEPGGGAGGKMKGLRSTNW